MRSTIIPAQITTVEDTIAGTVTIKQLVLLVNPVVLAILFYMVIPPFFQFSLAKVLFAILYAIGSVLLAIKVKERLVFEWIQIFTIYFMRPKHFIYNKNTRSFRKETIVTQKKEVKKPRPVRKVQVPISSYFTFFERLANHPNFRVSFIPVRKGGFKVAVYEIHE